MLKGNDISKWLLTGLVGILSMLTVSCTGTRLTSAEKAQLSVKRVENVKKMINDRHYCIDINEMQPMAGPSRHLDDGYSLEVHGDSIISYLPYFGRAYNVPYGGGKGLNFTATIGHYTMTVPKDGEYLIKMNIDNGEDQLTYQLDIFTNGKSYVSVWAKEREPISFYGELVQ
ncbi:MAG: DUF4251 domain-containing protein [Prevotellaceae bacterium]|nr:DUF4251 domain-containing protein [Prevotellaceae bacterium]